MNHKYQTLSEFINKPFGKRNAEKDLKYSAMYREFMLKNSLKINAMTIIEDSYYIHIKIPSKSNEGKSEYDVVIRFFTNDEKYLNDLHLRNYFIQFFSNSPGFIYKYAYVYNREGFLIEALYDKLDPEFKGVAPEQTNSNMTVDYDKSIYFACRFLLENQFTLLAKNGALTSYKTNATKFFSGISDFQSIKLDQEILNAEKQLAKELDIESKKKQERLEHDRTKGKKEPKSKITAHSNSNEHRGITVIRKKGAKPKILPKRAGKTTVRKK